MKIGVDIGGTKCAVVLGDENGIVNKIKFSTTTYEETLSNIIDAVGTIGQGDAIGISCGGPLDSDRGIIMSPPNLPDWKDVHITEILSERFGIPAYLCNDANACALAEWRYGAGRGTKNMVFLTFGTGLGAGLIINGKLYGGTNGNAGEVGHVRLAQNGPVGYSKAGSFEGFCSGGGLAQIGRAIARERIAVGKAPDWCKSELDLGGVNAKLLAEYAMSGDTWAKDAYRLCGEMLGRGLAVIVDILNPEAIVIGSVFTRAEELLREHMERTLSEEALGVSASVCRVLPAMLGDSIGDFAAISVALEGENNNL